MMNKKIIYLYVILCMAAFSLSNAFAGSGDLPKPPLGYSWKWLDSILAGILLPDGWFMKESEKAGKKIFLFHKDSLVFEGIIKTGFTVNVVRDIGKQAHIQPSYYAKQFVENIKPKFSTWGYGPVGDKLYFKGYGVFSKAQSPQLGVVVRYNLALGNDVTGTLYTLVFESPEEDCDGYWLVAKVVLDYLAFNPEY